MLNIFSHSFPTSLVLLEYAQDQDLEDFDLSIPLNSRVIDQIIKPRYPELVEKLTNLYAKDFRSGVMIDNFLNGSEPPSIVSFVTPDEFFKEWGVEAIVDYTKDFYAAAIYLGRDNLVRTVYRNSEEPKTKTDVHAGDGTFSHHEIIYTGTLPDHMNWVWDKQKELEEKGIKAIISHFKNQGENSKVYFKVTPN